ncbi:MAG TPA: AAA family ATPase, partial [Polyangiales bacterium]
MDSLAAIAGLPPDEDQNVQRSYLHTTVVGRDAERSALNDRLSSMLSGRGGAALIEGESGLGKSALLDDALQTARLAGAIVLTANARAHSGALGVWSALLEQAAEKLGLAGAPAARGSLPEALFLTLEQSKPVVLAIEELHEADQDSVAMCANFAKSLRQKRVLMLATLDPAHAGAQRPAVRLLRDRAQSIELRPFDEKATHAFVVGLFGEIAGAQRLATFLHNFAAGNPRASSEIVQHLIAKGFIRYAEGAWLLADELPSLAAGDLAAMVDAAFETRIARFSPAARTLAVCMTPQRTRAFGIELCRVLAAGESELEGKNLTLVLADLVREGVLVEDHGAYAFAGSRIRDFLYARMSPAQKKHKHALLAEHLYATAGSDPSRAFEIGWHLLLAGQDKRARIHINRNVEASLMSHDLLIESVPDLLALLEQQRAAGATDEDVQFIEGLLATSGYYSDPTIQDRFGDRAFLTIRRTVGFELATRLEPWLGSMLAVLVGVLVAWVKTWFRKPYLVSGSFRVALLNFAGVSVGLGAGACTRFNRRVHALVHQNIGVARGLPRYDAFKLLYDCIDFGEDSFAGRYTRVQAELADQLERLPRVHALTKESKHQWESALVFAIGLNQVMRLDSSTSKCAERLDELGGKHDRALAIFLRASRHLYRGEFAAAKRERDRYEQVTAMIGSRWLPDMTGAVQFLPYHWARDVLGLKRTLHRISQLLTVSPGLAIHHEVVRAIYEGHRGRPDLALKIYDTLGEQVAPFAHAVWGAAQSHRAECLNVLGRPAEALKVCEQSLAHVTSEARGYVFAYQQLERERALALAGLGRFDEAVRLMDGLLAECEGFDNPLVIGLLHLDRARIACAARDKDAYTKHADIAESVLGATKNPALNTRVKQLRALGRNAGLAPALATAQHGEGAISELIPNPRAARVLDEIVEAVAAKSASLYLIFNGRAVLSARHGDTTVKSSSAVFERQVSAVVRALDGETNEQQIDSALARVQTSDFGTSVFTPLAIQTDDDKMQVVALVVLNDCDNVAALARLSLAALASELREVDEVTDVI